MSITVEKQLTIMNFNVYMTNIIFCVCRIKPCNIKQQNKNIVKCKIKTGSDVR